MSRLQAIRSGDRWQRRIPARNPSANRPRPLVGTLIRHADAVPEAAQALAGLPDDGTADEERPAILRKLEMINRVTARYVPVDEPRN
jgi:hypothetical protein